MYVAMYVRCVYTHTDACMQPHTHAHTHAHTHTRTHTQTHIYICVYICMYMHILMKHISDYVYIPYSGKVLGGKFGELIDQPIDYLL